MPFFVWKISKLAKTVKYLNSNNVFSNSLMFLYNFDSFFSDLKKTLNQICELLDWCAKYSFKNLKIPKNWEKLLLYPFLVIKVALSKILFAMVLKWPFRFWVIKLCFSQISSIILLFIKLLSFSIKVLKVL